MDHKLIIRRDQPLIERLRAKGIPFDLADQWQAVLECQHSGGRRWSCPAYDWDVPDEIDTAVDGEYSVEVEWENDTCWLVAAE